MNSISRFSLRARRNLALAGLVAGGTVFALPGCNIPKLRHADAAPGLPDTFKGATTPDNSAHLRVDEFYNDSTLTNLIQLGLENNRELAILNQEVRIARNDVLRRRGAYLPFIGFGANAGADTPSAFTRAGAVDSQLNIIPGQENPNPLGNYAFGVNVLWQLDIWKQLRNAREAAMQRYVAAAEKRNFFVTKLVAEIGEKYYELMALDQRMMNLDNTIKLQQDSLEIAKSKMNAGRGTVLAVQRFQAEVHKNTSEKLIVTQDIIEVENRINFLLNRYPEPVQRDAAGFLDLNLRALSVGLPSQLLQNRPDIRQAERELVAAGLDIKVARAQFFPTLTLTGGVGYEAFNPKYIFRPDAIAANVAGNLMVPLINKAAIRADYMDANARQLEAVYNYQRTVVNAFTEVINRVSMVENYRRSVEIKKEQLAALVASVETASKLFQNARVEYIEVLFAQRDLMDARMVLIDTKKMQLSAVVNAYQALGGGDILSHLDTEAGGVHDARDARLGQPIPVVPAPIPAPPGPMMNAAPPTPVIALVSGAAAVPLKSDWKPGTPVLPPPPAAPNRIGVPRPSDPILPVDPPK
jgi:NodT family efflux transporter outer membrane factor (OMF) lipoprotein